MHDLLSHQLSFLSRFIHSLIYQSTLFSVCYPIHPSIHLLTPLTSAPDLISPINQPIRLRLTNIQLWSPVLAWSSPIQPGSVAPENIIPAALRALLSVLLFSNTATTLFAWKIILKAWIIKYSLVFDMPDCWTRVRCPCRALTEELPQPEEKSLLQKFKCSNGHYHWGQKCCKTVLPCIPY